jgi:glutaminyl-tRNA synthetase
MEVPPSGYHRLKPGGEVRLRYGFCIRCQEVVKDESGQVVEVRCTYDEATRHGVQPEGRPKVKGIIHWVSAQHAVPVAVRLYDRLFTEEQPEVAAGEDGDFVTLINPGSLTNVEGAMAEPALAEAVVGGHYQFELSSRGQRGDKKDRLRISFFGIMAFWVHSALDNLS